MKITLLAIVMIMAGYFLVLYAGVGFIQDKRFFSSAPKENLAAIPDKKERFCGAHAIGWGIAIFALLLFAGAVVLAAWDGVQHGFGFWAFLRGFLPCFTAWRCTTSCFLIGCCCATPISSRIFTRSSRAL